MVTGEICLGMFSACCSTMLELIEHLKFSVWLELNLFVLFMDNIFDREKNRDIYRQYLWSRFLQVNHVVTKLRNHFGKKKILLLRESRHAHVCIVEHGNVYFFIF